MRAIASTGIASLIISLCGLSGCATKYSLDSPQTTLISAKANLPNGAADRIIIRIDNDKDGWLYVNWDDARIVGIMGFAVPTRVAPVNPLSSIPPRSSVEYHVYPNHNYWPAGYYQQRRDGFSSLLVYDTDYDSLVSQSRFPTLQLYLPVCQGDSATCEDGEGKGKGWAMSRLQAQVRRVQ